jgi:hypothetical protein
MTPGLDPVSFLGDPDLDAVASDVVSYFETFTGRRLFDRIAAESPRDRFTAGDLYAVGRCRRPSGGKGIGL